MLRKPKGRVRNVAPKADRTYNGRVYHSKAEAKYAFELDCQLLAREDMQVGFRSQPSLLISRVSISAM